MEEEMRADMLLVIRELDMNKDTREVEELERRCEAGSCGEMSLFTDLMGDPICRIRNSPSFLMLVAEFGPGKEIVGIIRGCIKVVSCGQNLTRPSNENCELKFSPICTKLAYILGLRVSSTHRRKGIGLKLVNRMEEWFRRNGAEYSYMATELDNKPSLNLFTQKCHYTKFRTPSILVQPVFAHQARTHRNQVTTIKLTPTEAETLYRRRFSTTEFFPQDIDRIVQNKHNVGTFLAVPTEFMWTDLERFLSDPPKSWAVMSAWNCKEVFKLEIEGASLARRLAAKATRMVDMALPWLRIPSVPNVFRPFGLLLLYGLGGQGQNAEKMAKVLCGHAHNIAKELGCGVVVTEVASQEPLRLAVPHWKRLSCAEDVWCIKRLVEGYTDGSLGDWTKSPPGFSIFVDPREF